jgi:type IV pilus assembly protein PilA
MAANGWGCESATASSRYVKSIKTDTVGIITVEMDNVGDTTIDTKTLTLSPYSDVGMSKLMVGLPTDAGKQVAGWKCDPGTIAPKFLPGSCRG